MNVLSPCSSEAFRERLQTAAIKRAQEDERLAKQRNPSKKDRIRGNAMRRIEDIKLAKELGLELEDLQ